ncbi:hypothetical protein P152DRAFT_456030 [Eremomyces bilateralis CBS 781.70]|uniref:Uncharacterized protein n=1 Tax=Eremomyces bilateralis CBS 781.70 TaxID=1392243 RepID=A0A6G1GAQ7_9PEZI|nr:uncharacterized protein P152DRAFT_456030 [Eremomyces bilateralis CBS 781.70]KAF1814991.1 hypothetical protein P152DRAFT_456030 [Eremomyces bilateralis CBS 781.70]
MPIVIETGHQAYGVRQKGKILPASPLRSTPTTRRLGHFPVVPWSGTSDVRPLNL